jgi:hypothetical protein
MRIPYIIAIATVLLAGAGCGTQKISPTDSATTTSTTSTVEVPPDTLIVPDADEPKNDRIPDDPKHEPSQHDGKG